MLALLGWSMWSRHRRPRVFVVVHGDPEAGVEAVAVLGVFTSLDAARARASMTTGCEATVFETTLDEPMYETLDDRWTLDTRRVPVRHVDGEVVTLTAES